MLAASFLALLVELPPNPLYIANTRPPTMTRTVTPTRTATVPTATVTVTHGPCPGDVDGNGEVTIGELVKAVHAALYGCP